MVGKIWSNEADGATPSAVRGTRALHNSNCIYPDQPDHEAAPNSDVVHIALVFDDEPFPSHAPKLLALLAKEQVHMTFSVAASNVCKFQSAVLDWFEDRGQWEGLKTIGLVKAGRERVMPPRIWRR